MAIAKLVSPVDYPFVLHEYNEHIMAFLEKSQGESSLHSVLNNIWNLNFQLWSISVDDKVVGCAVTKIDYLVDYTALHVLGLSGVGWKHWKETHSSLEGFARGNGCDRITLWGRKGWKRLFDKTGFCGSHGEQYEHVYDVLHMKLKDNE